MDYKIIHSSSLPCGCCKCAKNLMFNWARRRHGWRLVFFYTLLTCLVAFGMCITFVLHLLIRKRNFFTNYRCGEQAIKLIGFNFLGMMGVTGVCALAAILLIRLIKILNNYTTAEFLNLGKWLNRLGCLVKWLPWLMALCFIAWFILNITNIIWIFADPYSWCSRRWSERGIAAVRNCRKWYRDGSRCMSTDELAKMETKRVERCNDGDELKLENFLVFTPVSAEVTCSFDDLHVCQAYKNLFSPFGDSSANVDWKRPPLSNCVGLTASSMRVEDFQEDTKDSSDLYRYVIMYSIGWNVLFLTLILLFGYVKGSTHFDALLYQPQRARENVFVTFLRRLTPFNK